MKKYLFAVVLLSIVSYSSVAAIGGAKVSLAQLEAITSTDLGVPDSGILPSNPFYFMKEFRRNIRRFFIFDSVKQAQYELNVTNEKAAEAKKTEEITPNDTGAIKDALKNYQGAQERLRFRLENLQGTSQNPNIDRLLEDVAEKTVKHEKVFDDIAKKFEDQKDFQDLTESIKNQIEDSAAVAATKDDPAKFASKLEKVFTAEKGGDLKHVSSVEILDRLSSKAPEQLKQSLENLRQDFSERLHQDLQDAFSKNDAQTVEDAVRELPGDAAQRSVILEEIKEKNTETLNPTTIIRKPAYVKPIPLPPVSETMCFEQYNPVCGADGKTYSNVCFAKVAGAVIVSRGECGTPSATKETQNIQPIIDDTVESPPVRVVVEISKEATIVIDESGRFVPQDVKIRKGGKVTWVNKGKLFIWPASNDHPSHLAYPSFDALKGIGNGDSYSFVFDRVGTWSFHDHLNSSVSGTVTVTE